MKFTKEQIETFAKGVTEQLNNVVFNNIFNYLKENPEERKFINPAFPFPKRLRIGILKNCLAIEYIGPEDKDKNEFPIDIVYNETYDLYDFLHLNISHTKSIGIKMNESIHNMNFFLDSSITYLCDYFYDFFQKREDFMLNGYIDLRSVKKPCVMNNCTFFYTDKNGGLKIRHIDLLELFPIFDEGIPYHTEESLIYFSNYIIYNKFPAYGIELHRYLNKFIELINLPETSEPMITKFIEKYPELLQVAFGFNDLNPQKNLIWQDGSGRDNLKPDFLPQSMDGYCNIMDFKLPFLKSKPIVGRNERKHPSHEIDDCIAQLDGYEDYCQQSINKKWLYDTYKIKIETPQRYIIMGHSENFSAEDRQKIRKIRNTSLLQKYFVEWKGNGSGVRGSSFFPFNTSL